MCILRYSFELACADACVVMDTTDAFVCAVVCFTPRSERNFLGLNQKLSALVELGQADSLFRLQWVDPWIHGDPNRTSRTLSVMNTR
jgi:hypothetical protein